MDGKVKVFLLNVKNHPWHLYPDFKIDEETAKALAEALARPHKVFVAEAKETDDGK
jgi:hypothetical protein